MEILLSSFLPEDFSEEYSSDTTRDGSACITRIRTSRGWRTLDSPYDPYKDARRAAGPPDPASADMLLLGAGSGFYVSHLLQRPINDMLIITASRALAEKNIAVLETAQRNEGRCTVIVTARLNEKLLSAISEFMCSHVDARIICHAGEMKAFPELFNPIALHAFSRAHPFAHRPRKTIKRVLFAYSGRDLIEPEIHSEMERRGLDVITAGSYRGKNISPADAWKILGRTKPDLVFSQNNNGSDRNGFLPGACQCAGIPCATWFFDDPRFIVFPEETGDRRSRFCFCWDSTGIDACNELGFENKALLPIGTDPSIFFPGAGDPSLQGRIVFVGNPSLGNEKTYFSCIANDRNAVSVAESAEKEIQTSRRLPTRKNICEIMDKLQIAHNCFPETVLSRLPAFALYRANLHYRVAALRALADLHPVVYGDGWEGLLPETVELRGPVDYHGKLASIYQSDAVHVSLTHLQMRTYPNQRIFDIGACGRMVIGDRLEGWHDLFGSAHDDVLFRNFGQLHDMAGCFANNPRKRHAIGAGLYAAISEHHTIEKRVDSLLETVTMNNASEAVIP